MKLSQICLIGGGTTLEIYDSYIFGFLLATINQLFFPLSMHTTMVSIASFSVLFIVRPIGALFWGILGDRRGKLLVFKHAILFMALATLFIGLLPTYNKIGVLAPILLLILRAVQGLSISGEFGSSVVLCYEQSDKEKRLKTNGILYVFIFSGIVISNFIVYFINKLPLSPDISWRLPFIFGGICGIILYYMRKNLHFSEIKYKNVDFKLVVSKYKTLLITTCAIFLINMNWMYFSSIYSIFGKSLDKVNINILSIECSIIVIISSFIFGYVFSKWSKKQLQIILYLAVVILYVPIIIMFSPFNVIEYLRIFYIVEAIIAGVIFSVLPILIIDKLQDEVHNSMYNIANNISTAIIVGVMPFLINYMSHAGGSMWLKYFFIINMIISLLSLISIKFINTK